MLGEERGETLEEFGAGGEEVLVEVVAAGLAGAERKAAAKEGDIRDGLGELLTVVGSHGSSVCRRAGAGREWRRRDWARRLAALVQWGMSLLGPARRTKTATVLVPLVIASWTLLVFAPVWWSDFVRWDDHDLLIENTAYRGLALENLRWMFTTTLLGHYQPVTWISFAINDALFGLDARAFHVTNAIIHAVNAVMVYFLSRRLLAAGAERGAEGGGQGSAEGREGGEVAAAMLAALLWGAHPLRAESVAWVTERRDVLSTMFLLSAVIAYAGAVGAVGGAAGGASGSWRSWGRTFGAAFGLLLLSLLSKAWGMSFFVIALILDAYPLRRLPANPLKWLRVPHRAVLLEKVPFAMLGIAAAIMAGIAQRSAYAAWSVAEWGIVERVVQAFHGLGFYVTKTVAPIGLSPLYELPHGLSPAEPRFLAAYGLVLGLVIAGVALRRRAPGFAAAGAVYVVLVAPVLGVFQSGDQFVADRYSYLACIGWSVLLGMGLVRLAGPRRPARAAEAVAVAAEATISQRFAVTVIAGVGGVCGLGLLTFSQASIWRDTLALWSHAVAVTPTPSVRANYAIELARLGRDAEAEAQLAMVVQARPRDGRAWFTLGAVAQRLNKLSDAEQAFARAIDTLPQSYLARVNLGRLYLARGRSDEAVAMLRAAVIDIESGGERPLSALPYLALGDALKQTGDRAGAEASFRKALGFEETRALAEAELAALASGR